MHFLTPIALALGAITTATAKDINCGGSFYCTLPPAPGISNALIKEIQNHVEGRDDGEEFGEHEYIDCVDKFCAFFEEIGDGEKKTMFDAKWGLQALIDHGCNTCGGVPINPDSHDVGEGKLKVDYVSDAP
ncbi:hypothetical protein ASPVEDRAFT_29910 [Aspergillus versicolor CBS 583.65]|uniref:Killer toxin Kp4 domain-containing protein n=1 Tax=Aspergillus versicolor CBS 583.65 TaxID=1036611 RepID=A0A1L9PPG0_ASPVE|nr:uncharacterized protein ASPVEDRAFT_29910 [Aspergillus versicolor CBS 583.65]OJJ03391.1 hypothetical protein ASPVEDRAFT_29910 [Aspergillus versicolor CBS 583.65]